MPMKRSFVYGLVLAWACAAARSAEPAGEALTIEGADGWKLHGTFYLPADVPHENDQARPAALVICHPMLSKTQVTYAPLVPKLLERGFAVLVYDPRGHGLSTTGMDGKVRPDWQAHMEDDQEHLAFWAGLVDDLARVKAYAVERWKVPPKKIVLAGASVGANAVLALAVKDPDLGAAVLLSPGANYRGLETLAFAPQVAVPLFVAAGGQDASSKTAPEAIFTQAEKIALEHRTLKRYPGSEHGTNLFAAYPELLDDLPRWLGERLLSGK